MALGLDPEHLLSPSSLSSHSGLFQHPAPFPLGKAALGPAHGWSEHLTVNGVGPRAARAVARGSPVMEG